MAYLDPSPDRLMPGPGVSARVVARATPADDVRPAAPAPRLPACDRRRLETILLATIAALGAGLVFMLAWKVLASPGAALIVTAMILLPIVSLGAGPHPKRR